MLRAGRRNITMSESVKPDILVTTGHCDVPGGAIDSFIFLFLERTV